VVLDYLWISIKEQIISLGQNDGLIWNLSIAFL